MLIRLPLVTHTAGVFKVLSAPWRAPKAMNTSRLLRLFLFVAAAFTAASAQQAVPSNSHGNHAPVTSTTSAPEQFSTREPRYLLRPGDIFDLQFEFSPEFNQSVTVQPDGYVTLKGVGDVYVQGKNVPELTQILHEQYVKFLANPVISVVLKEFEKPYFIANGMVEKPGKYELRGDTTVTEALAIAGGLNTSAKNTQVLLFRRVSQEWVEAKEVNVKDMLNGKNINEDVHLKPGDMIYVPKNKWSRVKQFIPYTALNLGPGAF
jgi:polysaccharide biosynthesis/export protein